MTFPTSAHQDQEDREDREELATPDSNLEFLWKRQVYIYIYTLWLFNIAMGNGP